jgi:WD40 repeat protein
MKKVMQFTFLLTLMILALTACISVTSASDIPTIAPASTLQVTQTQTVVREAQATIQLVVYTSDRTIRIVDPHIPLIPTYNSIFNSLLPSGGSAAGTAYVLDSTNQAKVVAIGTNGAHDLSFIQNPTTYGLAIWQGDSGGQPRLAWGTQLTDSTPSSILQISALDGSQLETLLTQGTTTPPLQLVAEFWSADGQLLYFSKELVGLGGYILFGGASNLYQVNITTREVTEVIPLSPSSGQQACLDAISGNHRYVADHCSQNTITIRDLTSGGTTTIQPPPEVSGFRTLGSARFSPDGNRLAYALARGDQNDEQGWVAVSDGTSGGSKLILTSQAGAYYTIAGWLNDQTLLVQSTNLLDCTPYCRSELWSVGMDGSNPQKLADGSLLTVITNGVSAVVK